MLCATIRSRLQRAGGNSAEVFRHAREQILLSVDSSFWTDITVIRHQTGIERTEITSKLRSEPAFVRCANRGFSVRLSYSVQSESTLCSPGAENNHDQVKDESFHLISVSRFLPGPYLLSILTTATIELESL